MVSVAVKQEHDACFQAEEVAIETGAENLYFTESEDEKIVIKVWMTENLF